MPPALVLGLVAVGVLLLARNASAMNSPSNPTSFVNLPGTGANVFNREVANGVHPDLQRLLDLWEQEGSFDVTVASGVRTQAQQSAAYNAGLTRASDVSTTPHGRGAALDIHPSGFNPNACFASQPGMLDLMNAFGQWAEQQGFTWGGRFSGYYSPACKDIDNVTGDRPHVEIKNWQSLPYPLPDYSSQY